MSYGISGSSRVRGDAREHPRKKTNSGGILHHVRGQTPVTVKEISKGGVRFVLPEIRRDLPTDGSVQIEIRGFTKVPLSPKWRDGTILGASFEPRAHQKLSFHHQISKLIR